MSHWSVLDREKPFKDSPFAQLAKEEGFSLWAVCSSYSILKSMIHVEENYFYTAEELAKRKPEHTETLYKILRKGMHEEAKNHTSILYAIENLRDVAVISKLDSLPGSPYSDFVIEVSSTESDSE
jgi:hypothetical protein